MASVTFELKLQGNEFTGTFGPLTYYFKLRQLGARDVTDFPFFRNGHRGCFGVLIRDDSDSVAERLH